VNVNGNQTGLSDGREGLVLDVQDVFHQVWNIVTHLGVSLAAGMACLAAMMSVRGETG
jgi:hypothetical protein